MFNFSRLLLDGSEPFSPSDNYRYCYDRSASRNAKDAQGFAAGEASTAQGNANADRAALVPFYRQEMNAQHGFNPEQTNELLNYAGETAAGGGSTAAGAAASEAARTRNTSGFTSALDANARDRQRALGTANLGVGAADIAGAKEMNQEGAAGEAGLFGTDTNTMLGSMGLRNQAINTQIEAGKSGWYQNLLQGINTFGKLGMKMAGAGGGSGGGDN